MPRGRAGVRETQTSGPKARLVTARRTLFEGEGGGAAGGEGQGVGAELGGSVEEDDSIDEAGLEEGGVQGGAGFEQDREDAGCMQVAKKIGNFAHDSLRFASAIMGHPEDGDTAGFEIGPCGL